MTALTKFSVPTADELRFAHEICKTLATAKFYQEIGPGGVLAIYLMARELNLPFMSCLNGGMYTFSGKVTLSAQMMNLLLINAGHRADVIHLDNNSCRLRFVRGDRPEGQNTFEYEYNVQMATVAGYMNKTNWKQHTRDMLFSRCLSGGARKFMPDALLNFYVSGEMGEEDENIIPIMPEEIREAPKEIEDQPKIATDKLAELMALIGPRKENMFIHEDDAQYCQRILYHFKVTSLSDIPADQTEAVLSRAATRAERKLNEARNRDVPQTSA